MYRFLRWCLQLERGEDGRHIKGINKASTFETDWKNLRCYYQKLTKIVIKDEDGSEIRRVLIPPNLPQSSLISLAYH
ncbi:unnamed protein product [Penicillium nalgiovense]|nr:unnamed protein product [Penicillium nalgiovense]